MMIILGGKRKLFSISFSYVTLSATLDKSMKKTELWMLTFCTEISLLIKQRIFKKKNW